MEKINLEIKNISFVDFYSLEDKSSYNFAFRNGKIKAKDFFNIRNLQECTFGFVKDIQFYIRANDSRIFLGTIIRLCELVAKENNVDEKDYFKLNIFDLFQGFLYLHKQIETINHIERIGLSSDNDAEDERAGIDRFNDYGSFIQINALAGGDVLKYNEILNQKYMTCFTKLKYDKDTRDFEKQKAINARRKK